MRFRRAKHFLSESEVASAIKQARREKVTLGKLLEIYRPYLLAVARKRMDRTIQSKDGASDLVQETLLIAQGEFGTFRGASETQLRQWLRQILLHCINHWHRRYRGTQKRAASKEQSLDDADSQRMLLQLAAYDSDSPNTALDRHLEMEHLLASLARLKDGYRLVIEWHSLDGVPFSTIGEQTGRSEAAVRMLWTRAIKALRQELKSQDE